MEPSFKFKAKLWRWDGGKASWFFYRLPKELSENIKVFAPQTKGFRSVPVLVKIGKTEWKTSLFPEKEGTYLLPTKKDVRAKESLEVDQEIEIQITIQI